MMHHARLVPLCILAVLVCVLFISLSQAQSCLVGDIDAAPSKHIIHWSPFASSSSLTTSAVLQRELELGEYALTDQSTPPPSAQLTLYLGATSVTWCFSITLYRTASDATAQRFPVAHALASGYANGEACGLRLSPHVIDQMGYNLSNSDDSGSEATVDDEMRRNGCWLSLVDHYTVSLNLSHEAHTSDNNDKRICDAVKDSAGETSRVQCRVWLVVKAYRVSEAVEATPDMSVRLTAVVVSPHAVGDTKACAHSTAEVNSDSSNDVWCAQQCHAMPPALQPSFWNMSTSGNAVTHEVSCDWTSWAQARAEGHGKNRPVKDDGLAHTATQLGLLSCFFCFTLAMAIHLMLYIN